jgi:hypothetical protein
LGHVRTSFVPTDSTCLTRLVITKEFILGNQGEESRIKDEV